MQAWTDFLHPDAWLTQILEREVFSFRVSGLNLENPLKKTKISDNSFVYAKVSVKDQQSIQRVQSLGFVLMDTQLQLSKNIQPRNSALALPGRVRRAVADDRKRTMEIARSSFKYSRFHRDSHFTKKQANELKAAWTANYFNGLRGDGLFIAEIEGIPAAYLLYLHQSQSLVIDLIATHPDYQRQGLASELLSAFETWAPEEINCLKVGTQLVNIPSLRLYLQSGYQLTDAYYLFHFHQEGIA